MTVAGLLSGSACSTGIVPASINPPAPDSTHASGETSLVNPALAVDGDTYYAFGDPQGSLRVPVVRSEDLATWSAPAEALADPPAWASHRSVGSPTVLPPRSERRQWVLYFTAVDDETDSSCIGAATADDVDGPYLSASEPVTCAPDEGGARSPSIHQTGTEDNPLLVWASPGSADEEPAIWTQPLSHDGLTTLESTVAVRAFTAPEPWADDDLDQPSLVRDDGTGELTLIFSRGRPSATSRAMGWARCSTDDDMRTVCEPGQNGNWVESSASLTAPSGAEAFTDLSGNQWLAYHGWAPADCADSWCLGPRVLRVNNLCFLEGIPRTSAPATDPSTERIANCARDVPEPNCDVAEDHITATPNDEWTARFDDYGDDNSIDSDWVGGDGGHSVELPDGRRLWIFGDFLTGTVLPDGTLDGELHLGNTAVVEDMSTNDLGETIYTTLDGNGSWIHAPSDNTAEPTVNWPGDALVDGDELHVVMNQYRIRGPLDFEFLGTGVARVSLPDLSPLDEPPFDEFEPRGGIAFTQVLTWGDHHYIYGARTDDQVNYLGSAIDVAGSYVARAPVSALDGPWEYLSAEGTWSADAGAAASMWEQPRPVADRKVVQIGDSFVRFHLNTLARATITASFACTPIGPWSEEIDVYDVPLGPQEYAYGAIAHPETVKGDTVLVNYSVNLLGCADCGDPVPQAVSSYRPRFIDVELQGLPGT